MKTSALGDLGDIRLQLGGGPAEVPHLGAIRTENTDMIFKDTALCGVPGHRWGTVDRGSM